MKCSACKGSGIVAGPNEYETQGCSECGGLGVRFPPTPQDLDYTVGALVLELAERRDAISALAESAPRVPLRTPYRAALREATKAIQDAIARLKEAQGFIGHE